METEERLKKQIRTVYTVIMQKLIDPNFHFPNGGVVERKLSAFISNFINIYGCEISAERIVDYCIFQTHKNRESQYQRSLATNAFGKTACNKYQQMLSKHKKFMEDRWLAEAGLSRAYLYSLISHKKNEHPLFKYIYMESEEATKIRCLNTKVGMIICATATLMWSPFSNACKKCNNIDECKKNTEMKYPELYRIRIEEYDKNKEQQCTN